VIRVEDLVPPGNEKDIGFERKRLRALCIDPSATLQEATPQLLAVNLGRWFGVLPGQIDDASARRSDGAAS